MATLLTSPALDVRIAFLLPMWETTQLLQNVVRQGEPIAVVTDGDKKARIINLAQIPMFTLDDVDDDQLEVIDGDGGQHIVQLAGIEIDTA